MFWKAALPRELFTARISKSDNQLPPSDRVLAYFPAAIVAKYVNIKASATLAFCA